MNSVGTLNLICSEALHLSSSSNQKHFDKHHSSPYKHFKYQFSEEQLPLASWYD